MVRYNKLHPNVEINYQPTDGRRHPAGDGRTVFFGATDGLMTDEQFAALGALMHPTVLGAVVPVCHSGVTSSWFTGPLLADIFSARSPSGATRPSANPGVKPDD